MEEENEQLQTNTNENLEVDQDDSEFEVDDEGLEIEEDWENQTEEETVEQQAEETTNQRTEEIQQQTQPSIPKLNIPQTSSDYTEEEEVYYRNMMEQDPFLAMQAMAKREATRMLNASTQVSSSVRRFTTQNPELVEYAPVIEQILPNLPDNIRSSDHAPEIAFLWSLGVKISQGGDLRGVINEVARTLSKTQSASKPKPRVVPQQPNQRTPTSSAVHNVRQTVAKTNDNKPTTTAGRNMQAIYPNLSPSQIEKILQEDRERSARRRR